MAKISGQLLGKYSFIQIYSYFVMTELPVIYSTEILDQNATHTLFAKTVSVL